MELELHQLAAKIGEKLTRNGLHLAVAESCTGGLLSHHITNIPGSSRYFLGGVVSYSYELKETLLGVPAETLERYGAVSRQTALAMARGCRMATGADISLAITGIAGPNGGTPEKPVGLTYVALNAHDVDACERHLWEGSRLENKGSSTRAALLLLRKYLDSGLMLVPETDPGWSISDTGDPLTSGLEEHDSGCSGNVE
jgi:PncC family amidohydrolase